MFNIFVNVDTRYKLCELQQLLQLLVYFDTLPIFFNNYHLRQNFFETYNKIKILLNVLLR